MPNWCNNSVEIYHTDPAMIERVRTAFNDGGLLQEFIPVPEDLRNIVAGSVPVAEEAEHKLKEEFNYANVMAIPKLEKITINAGVGEAVSDRKRLDDVANNVTQIAGQALIQPNWYQRLHPHRCARDVTIKRLLHELCE